MVLALRVNAALKAIAVPMLVVLKENAETQRVPSDLAVRAMAVAQSVTASSHANERIGLATERRSVRDTDFGNQQAPFETTRTGPCR